MKNQKTLTTIIENGLLIGFLTYMLSFIVSFQWQLDGFDELELILLSVITGFFLCIVGTVSMYFSINKFYFGLASDKKPKRRYFIAKILMLAILFLVLMDSIVFLIDDSVATEYMNYLNRLDPNHRQNSVLPMNILNILTIFIFGMVSYVIGVSIIRKNHD